MDRETGKATREQILQFMTTEHFTLQTAKSATVAEANGRTGLFLNSVSSAVVALAFVGQVSGMGQAFFIFALVIFPCLLFLGFAAFERAIQTAVENMIHSRGINRIRHYYVELAPEVEPYFIHSTHDDVAGALHDMGIVPRASESKWQLLVTNAGTVSVINSALAGVFAGMFARYVSPWPVAVCACLGALVFALGVYAHRRYQLNRYTEFEARLKTLFPSGPSA